MNEQKFPAEPGAPEGAPNNETSAAEAETEIIEASVRNLPPDGFVCGLISLILTCCCGGCFSCVNLASTMLSFLSVIPPAVALVLAIVSLIQRSKYLKANGEKTARVTAALILSIISLVITIPTLIFCVISMILSIVGVGVVALSFIFQTLVALLEF